MAILNKVLINYEFEINGEKEEWDYSILITPDLLDEYYGKRSIHKDLFCYLDFDRLVEDDDTFHKWLKNKFYEDAKEECEKYCL